MNRERRKEVAKVFFDISKYLLTAVAVTSMLPSQYDGKAVFWGVLGGLTIMLLAFLIMPKDEEK